MKKLQRIIPISFICLLLSSFVVYAKEPEQKTVKVGYFENEIFQEGAREGAVKDGYAYEYYHKLSEYTGWEYSYVYGDFADLYQMLLDGRIDMLAGLAKTEERETIIGYPDREMGSETYNMVKHADDETITYSYATLSGKKIGVLDSAMVGVLERFLDALKMDMIFIRNMNRDEKSLKLVEIVIDIAKFLDVPVVAEGVEDKEQVEQLKKMGCDIIQGYYFSKPVPPEEFEKFIEEK